MLVFADLITDFDVPLDDFRFGDAFAYIGHVEDKLCHFDYSFKSRSIASPNRTGPGK